MKSTGFEGGLNKDLATEVLRIKDALLMYPDERKKVKKIMSVKIGATPPDKPRTLSEWLTHIIINRESKPLNWTTPTDKLTQTTEKEKLTTEQKALLKSISYKLSNRHNYLVVSLAA
ncbi:MAG: hypothetical protein Q8O88_03760 [bacterium]|nr:hypothetical protein [bacterium]